MVVHLPKYYVTRDEADTMMRVKLKSRCYSILRWRAVATLLYRTGIRPAELACVREEDLDFDMGTIRIPNGKMGKYRVVAMDPIGWRYMEDQLWNNKQVGYSGGALICNYSGNPANREQIRTIVRRLGSAAKIERRITPIQFRRAHAIELAQEGFPLHVIQRQLGHNSISTTAIYINALCPTDAIAAIHSRTWNVPDPMAKRPRPMGINTIHNIILDSYHKKGLPEDRVRGKRNRKNMPDFCPPPCIWEGEVLARDLPYMHRTGVPFSGLLEHQSPLEPSW